MVWERKAETVRAGDIGLKFLDAVTWLASEGTVTSLVADLSRDIPIRMVPNLQKMTSVEFPNIDQLFFSADKYLSQEFVVSRVRRCVLMAQGTVLVDDGVGTHCLAEGIGDSAGFGVSFSNAYQRVEKAVGSLSVTAQSHVEPIMIYPADDRLNILLSNINNYGHWHVHNISFLEWIGNNIDIILRGCDLKGIRVLCPHGIDLPGRGMKRFVLNKLGQKVDVEIVDPASLERPVLLENLLLSSTYNLDNGTTWPAFFAGIFDQLRPIHNPDAPSLIYCNRSHAGRRGIENEVELEQSLGRLGFTSVEPGNMTYDQQRDAFANAKVIVGSHGAALTNLVYSHRSPVLVELTHPYYGPQQYGWFRNLAAVRGSTYAAVVSPVPEQYLDKGYNGTNFRVNIDSLCQGLADLVRGQ